jgi:S1-C subfamily serine protease
MSGGLPGVGAPVTLVGAPAISAGRVTTTVSTGVVRAVGRQLDGPTGPLQGVIEIDRDVLPDSDGGVLADEEGHVVGVALSGKVANGIGAVVPAAMTQQIVRSLEATGRVTRAWLGVSATDLDADSAMRMRVPGGAIVTEVSDRSPAQVAAILPGDVLLDLGDHPIASTADVVVALRQLEPGQHAVLVLIRNGRRMTMTITLGGR